MLESMLKLILRNIEGFRNLERILETDPIFILPDIFIGNKRHYLCIEFRVDANAQSYSLRK